VLWQSPAFGGNPLLHTDDWKGSASGTRSNVAKSVTGLYDVLDPSVVEVDLHEGAVAALIRNLDNEIQFRLRCMTAVGGGIFNPWTNGDDSYVLQRSASAVAGVVPYESPISIPVVLCVEAQRGQC
jgi:hypothetical protein